MEFLGIPLYDDDFVKLVVRFAIDLIFLLLLVFLAYFPNQKKKNYIFTFLMLNLMVFFLCFTLKKLDLGLGMALGLFAIFGILRYRTGTIRIKEMTYLFLVVGIAVINAFANKKTSYAELFMANGLIVIGSCILERVFYRAEKDDQQEVNYDKLDLLHPSQKENLIADLKQRTGLDVTRVEVRKIDLRTNTAAITVYCRNGF